MVDEGQVLQEGAPTVDDGWHPELLRNYEEVPAETMLAHARNNLVRFARFIYHLSGNEERSYSADEEWGEVTPVLEKVRQGGDIVDVAAGFGEPAPGFLLDLDSRFHLHDTRYLVTDIDTFYADSPDNTDLLGLALVRDDSIFWADPPEDFYFPWSDAQLARGNWEQLRKRVMRKYGADWDATSPDFFKHVHEVLGDRPVGLLVLRHPEIGDETRPELTAVFQKAISTLLREAVDQDIPTLITTSNNPLSKKHIQEAIDDFFEKQPPGIKDRWRRLHKTATAGMSLPVGTKRVLDQEVWVLFPQQISGS